MFWPLNPEKIVKIISRGGGDTKIGPPIPKIAHEILVPVKKCGQKPYNLI